MGTEPTRPPKHPPPWFVHVAWRVHRALNRLSGGRLLWTTGWRWVHPIVMLKRLVPDGS